MVSMAGNTVELRNYRPSCEEYPGKHFFSCFLFSLSASAYTTVILSVLDATQHNLYFVFDSAQFMTICLGCSHEK